MGSLEFIRRYRALPGPHAPVALVSAGVGAVDAAAEMGAAACLGKPFDLDELYATVAGLCAVPPTGHEDLAA